MKLGRTIEDIVELVSTKTKTIVAVKNSNPKYSYMTDLSKHGIYASIVTNDMGAVWFNTDNGAVRVEVLGDEIEVRIFRPEDINNEYLYKFVTEYEKEDK